MEAKIFISFILLLCLIGTVSGMFPHLNHIYETYNCEIVYEKV